MVGVKVQEIIPTVQPYNRSTMSKQNRSSDSKRGFGHPLKLPQMNTSVVAINTEPYPISQRDWLQHICFDDPLTPLSSEGDHDGGPPSFDTSTVTDIELDRGAYIPKSWLERICFEDPLTPLSSEGGSSDSLFESASIDLSSDQIKSQLPLLCFPVMPGQPNVGQPPPPALTREETYDTFDGPLTPLGSMEEMEGGSGLSRSVSSAGEISTTSKEKTNAYTKPQGSMFDAAHDCGWFPDPPTVAESEIVVSNFGELGQVFQFPPSAWRLGPDGRLVRNYDVTFESPSLPITGSVPVTSVVEREMRALMRQKEEVMRVLELERMRGIDSDEDAEKGDFESLEDSYLEPKALGPEGTEIYDGVSEYPEDWASHQSTGLSHHPTEELIVE